MYEAKSYSFDLHEDMVKLLREEFDVQKVVSKFAEAISGKKKGEIERIINETEVPLLKEESKGFSLFY